MPRSNLMIVTGLLLAAAATLVSAAPQAPATPPQPQAAAPAPRSPLADPLADPADTAPRVKGAEARQAVETGTAVLVDVRPKEAYDAEHAKGAISIPLSD